MHHFLISKIIKMGAYNCRLTNIETGSLTELKSVSLQTIIKVAAGFKNDKQPFETIKKPKQNKKIKGLFDNTINS